MNHLNYGGVVMYSDCLFLSGSKGFIGLSRMYSSESYFVENGPFLMRTTDGGQVWQFHQSGDLGRFQICLEFLDLQRGWVSSGGSIMGTSDGGETWETQAVGLDGMRGLSAVAPDAVWALGFSGDVYRIKVKPKSESF